MQSLNQVGFAPEGEHTPSRGPDYVLGNTLGSSAELLWAD